MFVMSIVLAACETKKTDAVPLVQSFTIWERSLDKFRPTILNEDWHDGELAWRELKNTLDHSDNKSLEAWIDLQVEIVDKTAKDVYKLFLRRLALQELEFYPEVAVKYYEWAYQKYETHEFTDQAMQDHLTLILERFDQIMNKE